MKRSGFGLVVFAALLAGCSEPAADVGHPKTFSEDGLSFEYPGNWKVTSKRSIESGIGLCTLTVETPGSSVATLVEFRPAIELDAEQFAGRMMAGLQGYVDKNTIGAAALSAGRSDPISRPLLGETRKGLRYRFTVEVRNQSVPHTAEAWGAKLPDRSLVTWLQSPDEDLARARPGFEQILSTMRVVSPK